MGGVAFSNIARSHTPVASSLRPLCIYIQREREREICSWAVVKIDIAAVVKIDIAVVNPVLREGFDAIGS